MAVAAGDETQFLPRSKPDAMRTRDHFLDNRAMNFSTILYHVEGGVARLTLNRPSRLNSFTDAMHADIVALGFAGCLGAKQVLASLTELRAKLPARTQLWVGGVVSGLQRRSIEGVQRLDSVGDIGAHLRQRHAMA